MKQRRRWIWFGILLVATLGLCYKSAFHHPWLSLNECLEEPEKYDGRQVTQMQEPTIGPVFGDGFLLRQKRGPSIRVTCDTSGLVQGEFIGITAVFHKEGYLDRARFQVAYGRREKIAVSTVPALLIVGLFLWNFRFDRKKGGLTRASRIRGMRA